MQRNENEKGNKNHLTRVPVIINHEIQSNQTPPETKAKPHSCTVSLIILTSSPGLNGGSPIYGQPSHRNASPSWQLLHEPVLPCTVKSISSFRSSDLSLRTFRSASALFRRDSSSAASFLSRPQVQSLQGRRRFLAVLGSHSFAVGDIVSG